MKLLEQVGHWLGVSDDLADQRHEQQRFERLLTSLFVMGWFVEARDPYTGGHLWRVSRYSQLLAEAGGLNQVEVASIGLGGFLHDLGKIGIPDAILRKAGPLTKDEYAIIKTHPDIGARLLEAHPLADLVRYAVHLHHERPDGLGYPLGLRGRDIPQMARIIGICDAFDAMTSHRPYRPGMPAGEALDILEKQQGRQFDAHWALHMLALGRAGRLHHIQGHSDDGIPLQSCPMCGPTLVLRREQHAGDSLFCHNCGSEFTLVSRNGGLTAAPTGRTGSASALQPKADAALISRAVSSAVAVMPVPGLMKLVDSHSFRMSS